MIFTRTSGRGWSSLNLRERAKDILGTNARLADRDDVEPRVHLQLEGIFGAANLSIGTMEFIDAPQNIIDQDFLLDTPECDLSNDADGDGAVGSEECPDGLNFMFWSGVALEMSEDQGNLLAGHPLFQPAG